MSDIEYQPVQGAGPVETQRLGSAPHIPPHYSSSPSSSDDDDDGVHDRSSRSAAYEAISRGHAVGTLEKTPHTVDTVALETAGSSLRPTLQTRYSTIARPGQKKLGHNYRPLKQLRKLAQRLIARWLLNFLFCALMVVLFKFYEREDILTQFEKRIFNGLFLGLSLFISMNMVNALKSMADMMKWSILARGKWTAREMDLLLGISSYQKAVKLLGLWKRKPWRIFVLTNWICLGLGAQVTVAILGLTFNHESEDAEFTLPGRVNVTRLDHYYPDATTATPASSQEDYVAHLYGDMIFAYITGNETAKHTGGTINTIGMVEDASITPTDRDALDDNGYTGWKFQYSDWTRYAGQYASHNYRTNRAVTVNSECARAAIVQGQDGVTESLIVEHPNKSRENMTWLRNVGQEGTTYVWTDTDCGARCAEILVFQMALTDGNDDPLRDGDFYNCTVTVSKVENTKLPEHELPDSTAKRAAASIGLSGFSYKPTNYTKISSYQSFLYNNATEWGQHMGGNPDLVASVVGLFTIGSLANMDRHNPRGEVDGMRLNVGVRLLVVWHYVYLCFGIILGGHAALAFLVCFRANSVFCKQDSPLSTARLLRPIVERLGPSGCAASGEEIADSFPVQMTYGVRSSTGGTVHHLDIGEDLETRKVFPEGYYD